MGDATIKVCFDDHFTTTTTDVARVWLTLGGEPDDTMSVAVLVRTVSADSPIHRGVHARLCAAVRECVERCMQGPTIELWTRVDTSQDAARGGAE